MRGERIRQELKVNTSETTSFTLSDSAAFSKKGILRILHVDDDASLLQASKITLEKENEFEVDTATSVDEALTKLKTLHYDAIVSDYAMPMKNGLDFLKELREQKDNIPFIIFTNKCRGEVAIKALNLGADRFVEKSGPPEVVYCELCETISKLVKPEKSNSLASSDVKYRILVEKSLQGIMIAFGSPLRLVFANESMGKMLGYSPEELISLSPSEVAELIFHEDRTIFFDRFKSRLEGKQADSSYEFRGVRKDGSIIWMESFATLIDYDGQPALQAMFLDVNERKKAEGIVRKSEVRYRELANFLPEIVFESDLSGNITFFNQRAFEMTGYTRVELEKG